MAWIRNNTFLAVFIAVMVVGVGVLGYLLYDGYGSYDQVAQEYDAQVKELKRLQNKDPFPNQQNLAAFQNVRNEYQQAVDDLQGKLAAYEPPAEAPLTPTQFQDRLRQVVDEITKAADRFGISYPADFYLGFENYRSNLPVPGATLALNNQLNSIQELVGILIKERVEKITAVKRATLPQESGTPEPTAAAPGPRGKPAAAGQAANAELVSKVPVVLSFSGPPSSFRDSLNDIVRSKRLYVVRAVQVKNQVDKGPERGQQQPPLGGNSAATPSPDAQSGGEPLPEKGPPPLRYVLGQEKIDVVARVELTKVAPKR